MDWLNISLINLYHYGVESALVGMNALDSTILDGRFGSLFVRVTIQLPSSQIACYYPLPLPPSFSSFHFWSFSWPPQPYLKRNHQVLKKGTEDRLTHHGCFANQNQKREMLTIHRWLERYGDYGQRFALTPAGFAYFSGFHPGMILPPQGTFNNVWKHFWLSQLGRRLLACSG